MANVEDVKQQLAKAEKELEEAKTALKEFKEGRYGQRLTTLENKLWNEEGTETQQRRWEKEKTQLEAEKKSLEADKRECRKHVAVLQDRLTAAITAQPGAKRKFVDDEYDELNSYLKRIKEGPSPSEYSGRGNKGWPSGQFGEDPLYLNHRPASASGNPVAIYHPVFEKFVKDCRTAVLTQETYDHVVELTESMSDAFRNEDLRTDKFHRLLERFNITVNRIGIDKCTTDGTALAGDGCFFVINVEVKPELGEGNGCPYIQGIVYYGKRVAHYLETRKEQRTRLPCFILYLAGPFLGVAGVIYSHGKILADPLIGPIPLMLLRYDREQMMKIARVFTALESAYNTLHEYYNSPETGPQSLWPYYQAFNYQHKQVEFEYREQLYKDKLLFVVETKQDSDIPGLPRRLLVKFTESYGEAVHQFCADRGFAPKLFECYKLSVRWKVVIMEYLEDYVNLYDAVDAKAEWKEKIKKSIEEMHRAGFVHGDLRKPNILYQETGESINVVLVDFDWAGEAGKVSYPSFLNIQSVRRHSDARSDKVITPEHDIFSLSTLM